MSDLLYVYPRHNLIRGLTPVATGAADDDEYPISALADDNVAEPWKPATSAPWRRVWDLLSAKSIQGLFWFHANFPEGLDGLVFAAGTTSATSNFTQALVVPPYQEGGWPSNLGLDLRTLALSYRYISLEATDDTVIQASVGQLVVAEELQALGNFLGHGMQLLEDERWSEHRTNTGTTHRIDSGVRLRAMSGGIEEDFDHSDQIRDWKRACGPRPFVLWPKDDRDNEPIFAQWTSPTFGRTRAGTSDTTELSWFEQARDLIPTPSGYGVEVGS